MKERSEISTYELVDVSRYKINLLNYDLRSSRPYSVISI